MGKAFKAYNDELALMGMAVAKETEKYGFKVENIQAVLDYVATNTNY